MKNMKNATENSGNNLFFPKSVLGFVVTNSILALKRVAESPDKVFVKDRKAGCG